MQRIQFKLYRICLYIIGVLCMFKIAMGGDDFLRIEVVGMFIASGLFAIAEAISNKNGN